MATFFVDGGPLDYTLSQFFKTFDLIVVFGKDGEGPVIRNLKRVCEGRILQINSFPPWDEKVHLTDHLLKHLEGYWRLYKIDDNHTLARYGTIVSFSELIPKSIMETLTRQNLPTSLNAVKKYVDSGGTYAKPGYKK
jgi:hypothetical protein